MGSWRSFPTLTILLFKEDKSPLLHEYEQIILHLFSILLRISQIIFQNAFGLKCSSWGAVLRAVPQWFPQGCLDVQKLSSYSEWVICLWAGELVVGVSPLALGCGHCSHMDVPVLIQITLKVWQRNAKLLWLSFFWFLLFSAQLIWHRSLMLFGSLEIRGFHFHNSLNY